MRIGYHEQTRLEPEIRAAMEAPIVDAVEVRRAVIAAAFEGKGRLASGWGSLYARLTSPLDRLWEELTYLLRRAGRAAVTEALMTLRLPTGEILELGDDLGRAYPSEVDRLEDRELVGFLDRFGAADSLRGSGAKDWADFDERMRFIAHFFRAYQREAALFEAPFTQEQTEAIRDGRVPSGEL